MAKVKFTNTWDQVMQEFKANNQKLVEEDKPGMTLIEWLKENYVAVKK